jgi:hypothetical protein
MLNRHTVDLELQFFVMARKRTFVPHASAMAVAATTDMMRVFLWVMTSSLAAMTAIKFIVLLCPDDHVA